MCVGGGGRPVREVAKSTHVIGLPFVFLLPKKLGIKSSLGREPGIATISVLYFNKKFVKSCIKIQLRTISNLKLNFFDQNLFISYI